MGNEYLKEHASRYNPNVEVIPTSVDTNRYYPDKKKEGKLLLDGWVPPLE